MRKREDKNQNKKQRDPVQNLFPVSYNVYVPLPTVICFPFQHISAAIPQGTGITGGSACAFSAVSPWFVFTLTVTSYVCND